MTTLHLHQNCIFLCDYILASIKTIPYLAWMALVSHHRDTQLKHNFKHTNLPFTNTTSCINIYIKLYENYVIRTRTEHSSVPHSKRFSKQRITSRKEHMTYTIAMIIHL
jgi:hypothetical protein